MGIFDRKVKYDDILTVAKEKVSKVAYNGEYITRIGLLSYLYQFYASKRGQLDFHDCMDVVERIYMNGEIKP